MCTNLTNVYGTIVLLGSPLVIIILLWFFIIKCWNKALWVKLLLLIIITFILVIIFFIYINEFSNLLESSKIFGFRSCYNDVYPF